MYCQKCGKEIADESAFCPKCGHSVSSGTQTELERTTPDKAGRLHCPKCKSLNISVTTESSVNGGITSHHGGVSATSLSNTHRNYWICSDCGAKFRNIQNLEEEIHRNRNTPKILIVLMSIMGILGIYLFVQMMSGWAGFMFVPYFGGAVIAFIVFLCFSISSRKSLEHMKKELEYLKENCFD